jgi:hypothetical protein
MPEFPSCALTRSVEVTSAVEIVSPDIVIEEASGRGERGISTVH